MGKFYFRSFIFFILCSLLAGISYGQHLVNFENIDPPGNTIKPASFTSNEQSFSLTDDGDCTGGKFGVYVLNQTWDDCVRPGFDPTTNVGRGFGVDGSNQFLDNGVLPAATGGHTYKIGTTDASLFTIKSLYIFISKDGATPTAGGVILRGKLAGAEVFSIEKNSNLDVSGDGFTKIDFSAEGGAHSKNIDELEIIANSDIRYVAVDDFEWDGPVIATPTITTTGSLSAFSSCSGTASSQQSFTVSGSNLTNNITVTAPSGYEVSTSFGSGYSNSITLTQSGGTVNNTTIYARLTASASGTTSGNITVASTGATTKNVAVSGTVNALPTITIGTVASVVASSTFFEIPYTATTGSPNVFNIGLGATPMSGFTAVSTTLSASPIKVNIPSSAPEGTYQFNMTVSNGTTNCYSAVVPITLTIKPPSSAVTSIIRASASPTNATSLNYTVTFDAAVTGVTADDFTLISSGVVSGIIGTPTGSGTTWTIPVTSVAGNGDLRLDFTGTTGITPNATAAFTSGEEYTIDQVPPPNPSNPDLADGSDRGTSNTDNLTSDTTPTFQGTATMASTVTLYDTDGLTVLGTANVTGGNWEITTSALTAGSHTVMAKAADDAGNTSVGTTSVLEIIIDTSAPTVTITSDKPALRMGETATITFTFSEDPAATFSWDGTSGGVTVAGGTLSAVSGTGTTRTATFTPQPNSNGSAGISLATGSYSDAAGNQGAAGLTPSVTFDTSAPTLTISSTPSGLKIGETATITFTFSEDVGASFTADHISFTGGGTLSALSGTGLTRTATFTPPGNTDNGTASFTVAAGSYADPAGNSGAIGSLSLPYDTKAPTAPTAEVLYDTGTSNTDLITKVKSLQKFFGTTDADASVAVYRGATLVAAPAPSGTTWSINLTFHAGAQTLTVTATDAAGNATSADFTIVLDETAPTLAISSNKSSLKAGETATVTFTFSEDPGATFDHSDIAVTGGVLGTLSGSGKTRTATFTPTANASGNASITVAAGAYTDVAGNGGGAGASPAIAFDTKFPALAITTSRSALKIAETATITFTFSEDPVATFAWNGTSGDIAVTGGTLSAISGTGLTRTATFTPDADTDNGTASITVAAGAYTDAAGNAGGAGSTPSITFDTQAPGAPSAPDLADASDSGISNTDDITNDTTPTFTGTAEAGATVKIYAGATEIGSGTATTGTWSITASALSQGVHTITAVATDPAGNTGTASAGLSVTIDTSAPASAVVSTPANGATVTTATPAISGTAEANSTVTVYVDGSPVSSSVAVDGTGNWTYSPAALANGGRTVSAEATDVAGNTGTRSAVNTITVNTSPTIYSSGSLTTFATTYGTASASQNFSVSATNLTEGILVTPPAGFEVSADNTTFTNTVTVGAAGHVGSTAVYVRLKSSADAGNYTGNISLTSTDATTVDMATHAINTVSKAALTITATGLDKEYDGGNNATVTLSDNRISGDVLTIAYSGATFSNKHAGAGKPVSVTGISIAGADADNYTFNTTAAATAGITAKALSVSAAGINKEYDGNTTAAVTLSDDRVSGDVLSLDYTAAAFDNKNAGTGKSVSVSGIAVTGTDAGNYTFNTTANATADITAKTLTITASGINKVYDGNSAATVTLNDDRISGDILAAAYAGASFDSKNAGIGKAISVNGISIAGSDASNYIFNTAASTTGNITSRAVTVTAQAQSKVYGEADPALTYTVSPPLVTGDTFTGALGRAAGENVGSYAIDLNTLALSPNYDLVFAPAALTITKAPLTITAGNKQKFVGTANPELTVTYSGFVNGEQSSVLSQQPSVTTTATTASPLGDYPITATGAAADNYAITYVDGTLKVVPGAPTSVALAGVTLHENRPAGTAAGTLSSTSEDPNAVFTYELVTGSGDTDNSLFTIAGDKLQTAASLNFEQKNSYSVRVRSTTQHGFSLDQVFTVALSDVNETPTLAAIADETICHTTAPMTVQMSGATAGPETSQAISYAVSSDNDDLFDELSINASGQLTYQVKNGRSGTANVTVTVTDNGGTANGGVDTFSRTFVITVNPLPVITIASDKGNSISKGDVMRLTATGGATYSWTNPGGIVSGQQSATVTFRPEKTATYRVTVTTAAGCVENHEITIEVKEDYVMLNQTNIVTPNGDGVNDNFVIKNIDMYPNNVVKIYDRAGRLLYSKNNYTNEWNGTVEGSPLAEGTYYYIVDFGTNRPVLKGFITIVKD